MYSPAPRHRPRRHSPPPPSPLCRRRVAIPRGRRPLEELLLQRRPAAAVAPAEDGAAPFLDGGGGINEGPRVATPLRRLRLFEAAVPPSHAADARSRNSSFDGALPPLSPQPTVARHGSSMATAASTEAPAPARAAIAGRRWTRGGRAMDGVRTGTAGRCGGSVEGQRGGRGTSRQEQEDSAIFYIPIFMSAP